MLYNVALVSAVQQRESAVIIYIPSFLSLPPFSHVTSLGSPAWHYVCVWCSVKEETFSNSLQGTCWLSDRTPRTHCWSFQDQASKPGLTGPLNTAGLCLPGRIFLNSNL